MKILIQFLLCCTIIACNRVDTEYPFIGKWAGLIQDEYTEARFTSEELLSFGLNPMTQSPIRFTVKGDSLYYQTFEMTVRYQVISDSILVISNNDFSDTLYRLDNSIISFDEIDQSDTIAVQQFYTMFNKRYIRFYKKLVFEDYGDYTKSDFEKPEEEMMVIEK